MGPAVPSAVIDGHRRLGTFRANNVRGQCNWRWLAVSSSVALCTTSAELGGVGATALGRHRRKTERGRRGARGSQTTVQLMVQPPIDIERKRGERRGQGERARTSMQRRGGQGGVTDKWARPTSPRECTVNQGDESDDRYDFKVNITRL